MVTLKPFRAIRPREQLASRVAALPYDVCSRSEAKAEVQREPLSFLQVDRAETTLPDSVGTYDSRVYERAGELLWRMVEEGVLVRDQTDALYLYELTMDSRVQTGLVGLASIDDYLGGVIREHEKTRADKEEDRVRHVSACHAQTGPIFLAYRRAAAVGAVAAQQKKNPPIFDFLAPDGVRHRGWKISGEEPIRLLTRAFADLPEAYIADGHHRAASAVRVGLQKRRELPAYTGAEEFNYFLSVFFPDEELRIRDYNRVVRDLNGCSQADFLNRVRENFWVEELPCAAHPSTKGSFSMFLGGRWYSLRVKQPPVPGDPVASLDVSVLQEKLLCPVLGIEDPKTDDRIDFVGGIRGLEELERRVNTDMKVAFALVPTSIQELFAVADAGLLMPPKSTWFEPKLRSGLFIHEIEE